MSGYLKLNFEPFPMHTLKRVDRPTTQVLDDQVKRVDERESGFNKAVRGDYGAHLQKERARFVPKHPVSGALSWMTAYLKDVVDGLVAKQKAPLPEDPILLSRHFKELAYFLRADAVGICKLPPYAVYTNSFPDGQPVELNHQYAIGILRAWRDRRAAWARRS